MKQLLCLFSCFASYSMSPSAAVVTLQGSSRWRTTFFESGVTTSVGSSSYITYTLLERDQGNVVNQLKIDAWAARNPLTGRTERWYYIDEGFRIELGNFGRFATDVGGGMQFTGISATVPFRGASTAGILTAFTQYPAVDYLTKDNGLDVTEMAGAGRLNRTFSGNYSLSDVVAAIQNLLESRGYQQAS